MTSVTVEGSRTRPCTELPSGDRRTCQLTDRVQRLIDRGHFVLIATHDDPEPAAVSADHNGTTVADPSGDDPLPTGDFAPAPTLPTDDALKAEWQAWLTFKGVWFPDKATKPELIAAWRQVEQQQDASNE